MNRHLRRPARQRLPKRLRIPLYVPRLSDTVWPADFTSDARLCGRRFRTFNVVDDFNRTSRDELLDQHLFTTLDDVREAVH